MNYAVTPERLIRLFGLGGVVYFPSWPDSQIERKASEFLSYVGLPHDQTFFSRLDLDEPERDPVDLGVRFDQLERECPEEARRWLLLGYLVHSLVALDPETGRIYLFPEGEDEYTLLHRDVQSLVFTLATFKEFIETHSKENRNSETVASLRDLIHSFDPLPVEDEESEWNLILEEVADGVW